ncbi:LTA synthase family protein [Chenggangzhangella methanolivorans]|uniref:LTA synthase family protein n=1 Tax=Chenggangzhangella methanolivorans TaxID=1437009 RepID=A0A9E6RBT4_9HYPH|nr:LTA synthase family protein [Chenggangzhangella methanolivorans]QZO01886.1 LTA synthase family protein [Chenggangzhangella methanolivorans]
MTALLVAFALSFLVSLTLESQPPSLGGLRAPRRALAIRLALHLALFAGAFALSWRPFHAAFVTVAIAFLFGAGSAMKARILGEPVVFSDFALVKLAIRHPRLYYAEKLAEPRALAVFAGVALATVVWFALEPSILPPGGWALLPAPVLVCAAAVLALRSKTASDVARGLVGARPDLDADVARFGLGAAMTLHWLVWRRQERPSPEARAAIASAPVLRAGQGPDVVIAIQCESFVDVAARGEAGPELAAYRALSREALAWGRCRVPAEGAYTMRAEFGFLTAIPLGSVGFDVFDPYLVAEDYAEASIGRRMKAAGRRTVFLHPYDRRFFARDELMPKLGFDRFVDQSAFSESDRFGPYVGDAAVAEAILGEVEAAEGPLFIFAVTIENHGPWGPGRLPGVNDGAAQYARHLQNSDRMIGRLAEALKRRPGGGLLCVYGDHAPARTIHPGMPDRRAADYIVWDARGAEAGAAGARRDLDVDEVGRMVLEHASLR